MQSGIDRLLRTDPGPTVQYLVADDATWAKWAWLNEAELWQVVALHSHLDPDLMWSWTLLKGDFAALQAKRERPWADPHLAARLIGNVERAVVGVQTLDLPVVKDAPEAPETSVVSFGEFDAWARRTSLMPIPGFAVRAGEPKTRSPWGSFSTLRLEQLTALCELWRLAQDGGPYDPEKPWTAPHPKVVKAKLAELNVPPTLRASFAAIARDPRVPLGPHPVPPVPPKE